MVNKASDTRRVPDKTQGRILVDWLHDKAADGRDAILDLQREAIERIGRITLSVIDQLLGELLKEFGVRNTPRSGNTDVVANARGLMHLLDALLRLVLVGETLH